MGAAAQGSVTLDEGGEEASCLRAPLPFRGVGGRAITQEVLIRPYSGSGTASSGSGCREADR